MLHRFAADALNDSKPEVALKFVNRALSLLLTQEITDFTLYQSLVELRVQILLVLGRDADALASLEEAREKLPNNPTIARWIEKLKKKKPQRLESRVGVSAESTTLDSTPTPSTALPCATATPISIPTSSGAPRGDGAAPALQPSAAAERRRRR